MKRRAEHLGPTHGVEEQEEGSGERRGGSAVGWRELDFGECDGGPVGGGCAGEVVGED